jgi:hypothetical protein
VISGPVVPRGTRRARAATIRVLLASESADRIVVTGDRGVEAASPSFQIGSAATSIRLTGDPTASSIGAIMAGAWRSRRLG